MLHSVIFEACILSLQFRFLNAMVILKQFIVLLLLLLSFLKNIVLLVNRYELREVEETVNVCIHRSKGYSSLYLEEVSEQIKIRQEIFKKCVQLRNQPFRYGKPNFEFSNEKARWVSSALEVRKCPHPTSLLRSTLAFLSRLASMNLMMSTE